MSCGGSGSSQEQSNYSGRFVAQVWNGMIWNIVDRRSRPFRWKRVNAIIEAVEHDNSVSDADQAPEADPNTAIDYDQREGVTVQEAVKWANEQCCPVTLYLYDDGKGTTSEGHFDAAGNRFD